MYTWIIFDFAGIHYVYLWCLAASFFKMLPLVATVLIGILGAVQYFFCTCYGDQSFFIPLFKSILIFVAYSKADGSIATDIFTKQVQLVNPTLFGFSVFLGLYAFGIQGIIYGPLLFVVGMIMYEILNKMSYEDGEFVYIKDQN